MRRAVMIAALAIVAVALLGQAAAFSLRRVEGSIGIAPVDIMKFEPGSNAGRPDVGGSPIGVSISQGGNVADVTIRPTYQTSWYRDLLRIRNLDTSARYVCIHISPGDNAALRPGDRAELYVFPSGASRIPSGYPAPTFPLGFLAKRDLLSPGSSCFSIGGGATVELDILVYMVDDGVTRGNTKASLRIESRR
ncbi:MAG: hypothetical protein ABDH61_00255 [Acidilobaceae archaeon]